MQIKGFTVTDNVAGVMFPTSKILKLSIWIGVKSVDNVVSLVHDVFDLVGEVLVLPPDFVELENGLLVGVLDAEQLARGVPRLLGLSIFLFQAIFY